MRPGVRLALDVGSVRIGVARSDPAGALAFPVRTLSRSVPAKGSARGGPPGAPGPRADLATIRDLVRDWEALEVLVGLPLRLDGTPGRAAEEARGYAQEVAAAVAPTPVRLVDERLSTVEATRGLRAAGRDARSGRAVVDQAAAVIICQYALDTERAGGVPPGAIVPVDSEVP